MQNVHQKPIFTLKQQATPASPPIGDFAHGAKDYARDFVSQPMEDIRQLLLNDKLNILGLSFWGSSTLHAFYRLVKDADTVLSRWTYEDVFGGDPRDTVPTPFIRYSVIPVYWCTENVAQAEAAVELIPQKHLHEMALDVEWNRSQSSLFQHIDLETPALNSEGREDYGARRATTSSIENALLGSGYTQGLSTYDGDHAVEWVRMDLEEGGFILAKAIVWFNR